MPSQRGKVYCTEWCWHIGRLAREGTGAEANSAPKLGVSLGARAWPRIGQSLEAARREAAHPCSLSPSQHHPSMARCSTMGKSGIEPDFQHCYITAHSPTLPAGRFEGPAAVDETSFPSSMDRAQHPSSTALHRRLKTLTSRDSLQAEERPPSIFKYIRANCAAMDSPSPLPTQYILCPYVSTDFQLQQALYYTGDAITSEPQTRSLRRKGQRQSPSQGRRSFELGCKR